MKKTFNQNFIIRKAKSKLSSMTTVYLRITIDGARTEFSVHRQCDPLQWIPTRGRLAGKTEDVKSLNKYLDSVERRIYDIFQQLMSSGQEFDGEKIKAMYLGLDIEPPKMLLEVYELHNIEFEKLVGKGLSFR